MEYSLFFVCFLLFIEKGFGGCLCSNSAATDYWSNGLPDNTEDTPINTTIAIFGDQGLSNNAVAVLNLVTSEGAEAIIHVGDFDYVSSPSQWDELISNNLGETFPYYSVLGNHDATSFLIPNGYQQKIWERLNRTSLADQCRGDVGYSYVCSYKGITFALTNPGLFQSGPQAATFVQEAMDTFGGQIRLSGWHLVQTLYQVEAKPNEATFDIYEQSRKSGAMILTAHCHNYARSKTMLRLTSSPAISSEQTNTIKPGQTIVTVTGTGGESIRSCVENLALANWWNATGCNVNLNFGALFCKFNYNGENDKAFCYFKQIDGEIIDEYVVKFENIVAPQQPINCDCETSNAFKNNVQTVWCLIFIFILIKSF